MYQMKLSRSAQHEPVRGLWYRVCETCFKSREGYNDHNGIYLGSKNEEHCSGVNMWQALNATIPRILQIYEEKQ